MGLVVILSRGVLCHDGFEELELLFHSVVNACLYRSHRLQGAFKESQCRAHRRVSRHIRDVHITDSAESTTLGGNLVE